MTINKAIEINTDLARGQPIADPVDRRDAIKLGIEALKARQEAINSAPHLPWQKLPGETKE